MNFLLNVAVFLCTLSMVASWGPPVQRPPYQYNPFPNKPYEYPKFVYGPGRTLRREETERPGAQVAPNRMPLQNERVGRMGPRDERVGRMGPRDEQAGRMVPRGELAGRRPSEPREQNRRMGGRRDDGQRMGERRTQPVRQQAPANPADAVAFSGNRKTSQYFLQSGPVIFDDVTTNIGGSYNSDYGVFTAFYSGIYLVTYNVVSPRKGVKTAAVDLIRNKEVINSASGSGTSGETSNSAVLFLRPHDMLSVQGRAESAIYCGDGGNDAFCSFNVVLLKIGHFTDSKVARPVPGW